MENNIKQKDIKNASIEFANKKFPVAAKGIAAASFKEGAEWALVNLTSDLDIYLADSYNGLKDIYWELKLEMRNIKAENSKLRKENKELFEKFFDMSERLNTIVLGSIKQLNGDEKLI